MKGPSRQPETEGGPERPLIIPIFLPHAGCPHRCVFCNQHAVTGQKEAVPNDRMVRSEVERAFARAGKKRFPVQISFYGGNFLGWEAERAALLLDAAEGFVKTGQVHGLRFSTRPDTVDDSSLDRIGPYTVSTVEIGAQSMDDRVLEASERGHDAAATATAVAKLRQRGIAAGIQLMVGLPWETKSSSVETARRIVELSPDFVRIYPTVVLRGSPMARWFRKGRYRPLSLEEAVSRSARLFRIFLANGIRVIRMGLHTEPSLSSSGAILAGPHHPAFGHLVLSEHLYQRAVYRLQSRKGRSTTACLRVHPRSASRIRGLNGANLRKLKARFGLDSITVVEDGTVAEYDLIATDSTQAGTGGAPGVETA